MSRKPNIFPALPAPYRLAVIASHPNELYGECRNLVNGALQTNGAHLSSCFIGYISQFESDSKEFDFDYKGFEVTSSLDNLRADLNAFQPNCVIYLGEPCLKAQQIYHPINQYRGSLFRDTFKHKAISTFTPKSVFRNWDNAPLFNFDFQRAVAQAHSTELMLPERRLRGMMSPDECLAEMEKIKPGSVIAIDIEGGIPNPDASKAEYRFPNGVTCVSISTSPDYAFIIPLKDFDLNSKKKVLIAFANLMHDNTIGKVLQNGLYDWFVLAWHWKIAVRNICWDTMISGWELYPELPKGLATQTSLYTEEPYYKFERKIDDDYTHYIYCCKDSAVTLEIAEKHSSLFTDSQRTHFEFNMSLLPPLQFMMLKGIKYNRKASDERKSIILSEMQELQLSCNHYAGREINLNSPKQMSDLLYRQFGFRPIYKKENGRNTTKLTTDADALLKHLVEQGDSANPFLLTSLIWKKLEGSRKQLEIDTDADGRVRCSYNVVGTETCRLSCQGSNTGSGTNLQTIMESNRKFYEPDEGHLFFQCDLSGADGWTVAVHCAEQGDPTMLDDYLAGIKPAKVIAAMHSHGASINKLDRPALKKLLKETPLPDEVYAASKAVQHGSNYGMKPIRMSENILEKSFKKSDDHKLVWVPPTLCARLQTLYFLRYPGVRSWQKWVEEQIDKTSTLPSASGHVRTFFGRPRDQATYRLAYAHEPQHNTTYATNMAMRKLWYDPENRRNDNSLIIQPLHSVHDALCGQFPAEMADWAVAKIRSYFENPIRIRSTVITIPFEGGAGPSWYHTKEETRLIAI